jgi:uncharacterized protein with GYD domain
VKLVVLAIATDEACKTEVEEVQRFRSLRERLERRNVSMETALGLLGKYDYLFVLDTDGGPETAFAAMSEIAQSGTMRTETFTAMSLQGYFELAAEIGREDGGRRAASAMERT